MICVLIDENDEDVDGDGGQQASPWLQNSLVELNREADLRPQHLIMAPSIICKIAHLQNMKHLPNLMNSVQNVWSFDHSLVCKTKTSDDLLICSFYTKGGDHLIYIQIY